MDNKLTAQIFDKVLSGDFSTEISMPDYEPAVKRLLRVTVTLTEPESYFDGGKLGMSGKILYRILYSGADGGLYETCAEEIYSLTETYKGEELAEVIICDVQPESIISRALAPRKLSLKCRIKGRTKGFVKKGIYENLSYIENPASIERLSAEAEYTELLSKNLSDIFLEESVSLEGAEDKRVISCRAQAFAEEIHCVKGEAVLDGNLFVSMLIEDGEGKISSLEEKIPFSELIPSKDLNSACKCTAKLTVVSCDPRPSDNEIGLDVKMTARLLPTQSLLACYTKDIYSTEYTSEITKKLYTHPKGDFVFSGSVTVSLNEEADCTAEIVDVVPTATVKGVEFSQDRCYLLGDVSVNLLLRQDGEYEAKELREPLRYEIPTRLAEFADSPLLTDVSVCALSPKAKAEGGKIFCGCELHLCGRLCFFSSFEAVESANFLDPISKESGFLVYFPSPTDTLWDTAKKNHVTTKSIKAKNPSADSNIPEFLII